MKHIISIASAISLCAFFSSAIQANELVVTPLETKDGMTVAFDVMSEGDIAGFNFNLNIPGLKAKAGNFSSCVAELPRGFDGACTIRDGAVAVYATSNSPSVAIPAGVSSIGKINLNYRTRLSTLKSGKGITVDNLAFFNNDAVQLPSKAVIEGFNARPEMMQK